MFSFSDWMRDNHPEALEEADKGGKVQKPLTPEEQAARKKAGEARTKGGKGEPESES